MSLEKTILAAGAECVAGHLVLKHKVLGSYIEGAFVPSAHGLEFVAVEPEPVAPAPAVKSKPAKAVKPADESADLTELEDMLGE